MIKHQEFVLFYQKYSYVIFRRCQRLLGDDALAMDVTHDVFLFYLEHPQACKKQARITTFLYAVATNKCLNALRRQKARLNPLWLQELTERLRHTQISSRPDNDLHHRNSIHDLLSEMDDVTACITIYRYLDGCSQTEIAELLGVSRVTVHKKLRQLKTLVLARGEW